MKDDDWRYLWNWWAYIVQYMLGYRIAPMDLAIFQDIDEHLFGENGVLLNET